MKTASKGRFLDEETQFGGRFSRNVARTIGDSFAPFKHRTIALLVTGFFARISLLATANITGYWADSLCTEGPACKAVPAFFQGMGPREFLSVLVSFVVVGFVLNVIFRVGISRTGARAVSLLYDEVTMRVSRLPMAFFDKTPVGRIMSRFSSDYAGIFRMAGGPLGEFLGIAFDLVAVLILLTIASPYYLTLVAVACVAYYTLYRHNVVRLRVERRAYAALRGPAIAHFAETVQGARPIKVFSKRKVFTERFDRLVDEQIRKRVRVATAAQNFSLGMATITALLLASTSLAGLWLVGSGRTSAGSLATAFTFILIVSTTIQQFFEWLSNLEDALTGVERMDDYLRRPMERGAALPKSARFNPEDRKPKSVMPRVAARGADVVLKDVWLRYGDDLPWVLQGIDLHVKAGERLGIVGRTGSGKSSLIQALFLLYPLQRGTIEIGGVLADAPAIDLEMYRRRIALIPQDPSLFRGTLKDNLVPEGSAIPEAKLWETLEAIGIASFVRGLGQGAGLAFQVEERGANLSAGERQLLCMARCFLADAPVLVTDEATSAIDPASEELLVRALTERTRGLTSIMVAHRLTTVATCDRVLWLEDGKVKMIGPPSEVLPVFQGS